MFHDECFALSLRTISAENLPANVFRAVIKAAAPKVACSPREQEFAIRSVGFKLFFNNTRSSFSRGEKATLSRQMSLHMLQKKKL